MKGSKELVLSWSMLAVAGVMACYYMISFEVEQRKAEPVQTSAVVIQSGFVACVDEVAAQQALIIDDINVLVDSDRCLPTEEVKDHPADILGEFGQLYLVRVYLPDDQAADLFVPIGATH